MNETWKDVVGYEGLYQASNLGRIKRILFVNNQVTKKQEHILKQTTNKHNRKYVSLYKNGVKKTCIVHRIIAKAFIPNPNNYPQINHIDGHPDNNNVDNLEWCTAKQNCIHAYHNNLTPLLNFNNQKKKPIVRSDNKIFDCSYSAANELAVSVCSIRDCLKGRINTCKGYSFEYVQREWGNAKN